MSTANRVRNLLERGLQFHRAGDLLAAEKAYIQASGTDPRNADALNLRGVVALATGREPLAATLFRKAAALQPDNPGLWGNLGSALFESGSHTEAAEAYRRASRLAPENPDFAIGIATALAAGGHADDASHILLAVVERRPDRAAAWFNLGKLAESAGDRQQALEWYQRALAADASYGSAHLNLGVLLQAQNLNEDAERHYRAALASGAPRETAYINLVSLLTIIEKFGEAEQLARTALSEFPRCAELHRLLSGNFVQQGRLDAALQPAREAAALNPADEKLQMAVAGLLFECGFPEQGISALEEIARAHPDDTHIAHVLGVMHLTAGRFEQGWRNFIHRDIRYTKTKTRPWLRTRLPPDLRGQPIHLVREQGLGDELFFLRYAPLLKSLGAHIAYVGHAKLESILKRTDCIDRFIVEPDDNTREQVMRPDDPEKTTGMLVGDIAHALGHDFAAHCQTLPDPLALTALPERIARVREKLALLGPPPYLALTWRGGVALHEQKGSWWGLYKNIAIADFGKALCGLPHTLLAVQRKPLPGELAQLSAAAGAVIHDLCDINDDLEEMLALLAVIDDYVGVSNTNMHLRAGLKRRACVLATRPAEWRWMAYGERSPWFPDFTVCRQGIDGTWRDALSQLRAHLLPAHSNTAASPS
jgi:tetratricopeptide (TPR) repeat protein